VQRLEEGLHLFDFEAGEGEAMRRSVGEVAIRPTPCFSSRCTRSCSASTPRSFTHMKYPLLKGYTSQLSRKRGA
jgi:hypothetical protein